MKRFRGLLKVQPGEGRKVLHFSALNALIHAGVAIGVTVTDTLFLSEIGIERLPYVYLLTPILMLAYVAASTPLYRRWGSERAFLATLGAVVLGAAVLFVASASVGGTAVFFAAKFFAIIAGIALYTLFWNFTDSFFDIQDAKRLFSLFSAGGAVGAIAGGMLVAVVSEAGYVEPLFLAWAALGLFTLPLLWLVHRRHEKLEEETEAPESTSRTTGLGRAGAYLPLFAAAMAVTLVVAAIAEYQYLAIFAEANEKEELSALLGRLYAVAGGVNLLVNLFLFNRMVLTLGVPTVALITPIAFLAAFTYLLVSPGVAAAVVCFLVCESILQSIDLNNQNFLYNAFPSDLKKQIRNVFEGLGEPIATALGGLFLLIAVSQVSPAHLSMAGIALSAVAFLLVILLRGGYLRSMVRNLKESWLDLSRPSEDLLIGLSRPEIEALRDRAAAESNLANVHAAIRILWLNDRELAVDALLEFLGRADAAQLVASRAPLSMILEEKDSEALRRILYWVTEHRNRLDAEFLEELGFHGLLPSPEVAHYFDSEDPAELGAAVVTSWNSWRPEDRLQAMRTLERLVQGAEPFVEVGVRASGQLGQESLTHFIVPYLHHADTRIQRQAVHALRRTVTEKSNRLIPEILKFLEIGEEEDRLVGLEALAKIADTSCVAPLLRASGEFAPRERRAAEAVLLTIGLKSVPTIMSVLRDSSFPYRGRSLAARALGKLALPQLAFVSDALIRAEVERAYLAWYFHEILESVPDPSPGVHVLSRFHADMQQGILDFVLEILAIGGRLPDFELISSSLRSSSSKERANAVETIEQGVPRPLFRHILPLVEGVGGAGAYHPPTPATEVHTPEGVVVQALSSPFPIVAAAAAQALMESDSPHRMARLKALLTEASAPLVRDTLASLLAREPGSSALSPIERLHHLATCAFFERIPLTELEAISRETTRRDFADGESIYFAGDPATELHVVIDGSVAISGAERLRRRGDVFGEEAVFGVENRDTDARSNGASTLVVSSELFLEAIRTHSTIGVEMYRHRLNRSDAYAIQA